MHCSCLRQSPGWDSRYLQKQEVVGEGVPGEFWVGDDASHTQALLGFLRLVDIVGSEDDCDVAIKWGIKCH